MRTYRIRPTSVAALEDDDVIIGHDGKPVLWRDHPERFIMRNESSWHYPRVVDPPGLRLTEELIGFYVVLEEGAKPVALAARPAWPAEERILVRKARLDGFMVEDLIGTRVDHPSGERVTSYPRYKLHNLDGEPAGELWRDQPKDVDQIYDWVSCPIREDVTEWPTAKRIQVLAGTIGNERITTPVVAERVGWHDGAFNAQECFPKYRIVQGTAPVGATDVFYKNYDSDRITRYAVLEESDDD